MSVGLSPGAPVIRTPDQRLRVFVSSTLGELADERRAVRAAIERLHLIPVMFELGARPHPPRALYRAYLAQSHVFVGIYWQRYGWVAPGEDVSGLEDEYRLAGGLPQLLYLKEPAPDREPRLQQLLDRLSTDDRASYRRFGSPEELARLVQDDLVVLLTERFETAVPGPGPGAGAPSPTVDSSPPVPLTPTVGRDDDIAAVTSLLVDRHVRLVTVTGPGGIGKSRLALEVARRARPAFPDGVHLVPLEPVTDSAALHRVIADRLGIVSEAVRPVHDLLLDHLADRHLLLLVDNFEHLAAAAPDLAAVLDQCPGVQVLATSRQPLRLRGEQEYPLAPLEVPEADDGAAGATGVELFVQRARAVRPDFALTADNVHAVAELVRRLDGLPLAIELAAARIRLLAPQTLLARLEERLDVLASGAVDLPERQRTLRATIDWSYRLLAPEEQLLLDRLSVFAGEATLEAAEAVCGDRDVPDVLETLSSLLEKSLLLSTITRGEPRVQRLFTVRAFAAERLAERGESARMADRHADYFLERARLVDPLSRPEAHGRFDQMLQESDDIRAAMAWVVDQGDVVRTARFAAATWMWFWLTGRVQEVRQWFERAGALADDPATPADVRGQLLYALGEVRGLVGDAAGAVAACMEALDVLRSVGNELGVAGVQIALSASLPHLGRHEEGYDRSVAALEIGERLGEPHVIGYAAAMIATTLTIRGDLDGARRAHRRQLEAARTIGFQVLEAQAQAQLGYLEALDGNPRLAWDHLRAAADLLVATGNREVTSYWCDFAARALLDEGDPVTAAQLLAVAERERRDLGLGVWPQFAPVHDAMVAEARAAAGERVALSAEAALPSAVTLMTRVLAGRPDATRAVT